MAKAANRSALGPDGDDQTLVRAALENDQDAFVSLVRRHDHDLRILANRIVGRTATDDVLQEAYFRAYRALRNFRIGDGSVRGWLCRIVYSCCIDSLRQSRRSAARSVRGPVDDADPASLAAGPHEIVTSRDGLAAVFDALPIDERAAVILVDGLGFDYASAGRIMKVPPGTLASRLHRARKRVREVLENDTT
jgi:RNA polymerase sigma-70 factor (ECF subfamily)